PRCVGCFSLMRGPPRATLFPYMTLFRSATSSRPTPPGGSARPSRARSPTRRSEEHTSELQSHLNLVCRLLLEKTDQTLVRTAGEVVDWLKETMSWEPAYLPAMKEFRIFFLILPEPPDLTPFPHRAPLPF